jgi:hypothetical protein
MNTLFRFLLAALATWRLAFLLVREDGPGHIFARLRNRLGNGFLGQLLGCVKCVGLWVSIPFAFFVGGDWIELVVMWLALSGVTALIDEWTHLPFEWHEAPKNELLPGEQRTDGRSD